MPESYIYLAIIYAIEAGTVPVIRAQLTDYQVFHDRPQESAISQCINKRDKAIQFIDTQPEYGIMTTCKPFRS